MNWEQVVAQDKRASRLLARFGAKACSAELVCDGDLCGHITASALIWNLDRTRVLRVWSAKNGRWQLPGAHGEGDLDLAKVAHREALRALGLPLDAKLNSGHAVTLQLEEIAEYWNTPAHLHFAVVFEFQSEEKEELPRGARWFGADGL